LDDGPPGFPQGFSSPMVLGILLELESISLTGLSPSLATFPRVFCYTFKSHIGVPQPRLTRWVGLDCTRFARRYSGYLLLDFFSWRYWDVSIPSVCFPTLLHLDWNRRTLLLRGYPIRKHTGQTLFWQLTVLFRGLNRPSSPTCPKASISCPKSLIICLIAC
jgi:hypothetical protein